MAYVSAFHNQICPIAVNFGDEVDISHIGDNLRKHILTVSLLNGDVLEYRHAETSRTAWTFPRSADPT